MTELQNLANEKVDIVDLIRDAGVWVPQDAYAGNLKLECPFSFMHLDDSDNPRPLRLYEGNAAYCFVCLKVYTPVSYWATKRDISWEDAAQELLDEIGYVPETIESRWEALLEEEDAEIDKESLVEALKLFCARIDPDWEEKQFTPSVSVKFSKCLDALRLVNNDADVMKWLTYSKEAMKRSLEQEVL